MVFSADPLPNWALEHARASLAVGHKVSEIEQRLIEKGLKATIATAVVNAALEAGLSRSPAEHDDLESRGGIVITLLVSTIIGGLCSLFAYLTGGEPILKFTLICISPAMTLIWSALILARRNSDFARPLLLAGWTLLLLVFLLRAFRFAVFIAIWLFFA